MCPPRCCQGSPIPLQQIQQVLDPELFKAYQDRTQEINTPHKDRMYCSRETRVSFTTLSNIDGRWAACQKCGRATCVSCGEKEHGKTQCGVDTSEEQVKELARESGWKSCPKCGHLIERESGCNEIICRYGAKVCYRCGGIFDICSCPVIEFFGDDYFEDEDEDEDNDNFGDNNVNDFGT
ncbi:MAG: hypothetical protein MMC23_004659 [Stictis urceolatum]|nr:hypothetical protein [Stictis urceolata]